MPEHLFFHFAFLCQVLVISAYLPRTILRRMRHVLETYPPETHPKLYPGSVESYELSMRIYRVANRIILLAGLLLLGTLVSISRSGEWDHVIATWFFFLQCIPLMILDFSSILRARQLRESSTKRTAELRARRLLDFVSPGLLTATAVVYLGFVGFIIYVRQFDYAWFGGFWNIVIITIANLFFAAIVYRAVYGKKRDPLQSPEDRNRRTRTLATTLMLTSIAATLFIALHVTLAAFDLRLYQAASQSVYFQLLAVISFRVYQVTTTNFDVYRGPAAS